MRVLHLNTEKTWRGGERQVLLTVAEQRRQGLDAHLACRHGSLLEAAARKENIPVISLPKFAPATVVKMAGAFKEFDLLHCHSARAHSLAVLANWFAAKPMVVSRRVDFAPKNNWFNRFKYQRTAKVVCVSRFIAWQMRELGLSAARIAVVYDAVPEVPRRAKEICRQELQAKINFPVGKRLVGNIAALVPHKDQATLLRAARIVADQRKDVAFIIIGDGELRAELLQLHAKLKLDKHVFFTGFVPQAQELLPVFDVFAMSSCMEGLGSIVLDAGLAGVPVAATAGGGLPEIVSDNSTGLLTPVGNPAALADSILRLLGDPVLASRLVIAAQTRIRAEFSVPQMANQYLEIYQEVLAKKL